MNIQFYQMLSERIESAAQRSRWILLVASVISLAQIGAAYNFGYSFIRKYAEFLVFKNTDSKPLPALSELQSALLKSWVDQLTVNINIIGLKFSVTDASLIGAFAILIISAWLFYGCRRENHLIGKALMIANTESNEIKNYIFHSICSSQMFGTLTDSNEPISTLSSGGPVGSSGGKTSFLVYFLFYLPAITVFFMVFTDIMSLMYFKAVFRGQEESVYNYLSSTGQLKDILPIFFITLLIEICILGLITHILRSAIRFQQGTVKLIRELEASSWGR